MSKIKLSRQQLQAVRSQANYMVLVEKRKQKEVAKTLGISEKSMSNWAKQYGWAKQGKEIESKGGLGVLMDGYFEYVKFCVNKETSQKQKALWDKYLQRLGADFTKDPVGE